MKAMEVETEVETKVGPININNLGVELEMEQEGIAQMLIPSPSQ